MGQFTNEPWTVYIRKEGGNWDYQIRTVKPHNVGGEGLGSHIATANNSIQAREDIASLLASAPDLLKACKDALSQIGYLRGRLSDKERRFVAPTTNACEEAMIAAIAKAEGR